MRIALIAAVASNGVIGRDGDLPWHLPGDLAWFRQKTWGRYVLLGRKTWESFGKPLVGRTLVAITRDRTYEVPEAGVLVAHSLGTALEIAQRAGETEVLVAGGAEIYRQALPQADLFYLTEVDAEPRGDTRFPAWEPHQWRETFREEHAADARHPYPYRFLVLERPDIDHSGGDLIM